MDHLFKHGPWVLGRSYAELLNFLELMHSENTPSILSMCTCFLSEAWWGSSVFDGECSLFDPFSSMHSWNGLFWGCNQIVIFFLSVSWNFVELIIKITELAGFSHDFLSEEERRLNGSVLSFVQKGNSVVYEGLVEKHSWAFQKVTSMAGYFLASLRIIASKSL